MFSITAKSCRTFTFVEVLIMAAMNVETVRLASENRGRSNTATTQRR
jgi:hypothetical protein